jgi:peptidoglycan/xylan/chitin deacetylase (PgdA/CDA1 family)
MFEAQLAALERRGFVAGGHRELADLVAGSAPERPLVFLTFDDGFADNGSVVCSLLAARGWKGLVFLLPPLVDVGGSLDWPEVRARHAAFPRVMRSLDWPAVEAMCEAGMEFGSHTNTHARLPALCDEELREELLDSRRRIADRLGSCRLLAYPFGVCDERVAAAAADAGYEAAFTLPSGAQRTAGPLSIPRIAIDHRDDDRRFALKLSLVGRALLLSEIRPRLRALRDGARMLAGRARPAADDIRSVGVGGSPLPPEVPFDP